MAKGGSQQERRHNQVFKAMNRPLTILGAERRLFFVALISGGSIFSLMHSLLGLPRHSGTAALLHFATGVLGDRAP